MLTNKSTLNFVKNITKEAKTIKELVKSKKTSYLIYIDALFLLSVFLLNSIFTYFVVGPSILKLLVGTIFFLVIIFLYSFAKKLVLKVLFNNTEKITSLMRFYKFNLIIIFGSFVGNIIVSIPFYILISKQYHLSAAYVVSSIYWCLAYIFLNISHLAYAQNNKNKKNNINKSIKTGFKSLGWFKSYKPVIFVSVVCLLYLTILVPITKILNHFVLENNYSLTQIYAIILVIICVVSAYLLFVINKLYFHKLYAEKR